MWPAKIRRRLRPKRSRAGFSILEAMVSAVVLGIGMVGLVKMHTSAIGGMQRGRDVNIAEDIATQAAEEMVALGGATLASAAGVGACNTNVAVTGCRVGNINSMVFAANRTSPCTKWVGEQGNTPDYQGNQPTVITTEAAAQSAGRRYRVDRVISRHPSVTANANTRVVDVFVCWRDEKGVVKEIQTTRVAL